MATADWATHIHSGFWRINLDLGDPFANSVGYKLVLHTEVSGRHNLEGEEFTHHDFWVTRARPLDLRPRDLPSYERGQMLEENRPVL